MLRAGCALYALLILAWLMLSPGTGGIFIFDDNWNLHDLQLINEDPTFAAGMAYAFEGVSSTIGRPLALITFALQHDSWPYEPGNFIRVNILVHLLNAALLFWWLTRLQALCAPLRTQDAATPLLVVWLWTFAIPQAGAALYVVQRMTELSATMVLCGLLIYTIGRGALAAGRVRSGYALTTLGMGVGLVLGMLAKENAALFPLLVVVLEATLLRDVARPPSWPRWRALCLHAPLLLLGLALLAQIPSISDSYRIRDFNAWERLLTEGRILFGYLERLLVPFPASVRLHYDDVEISRSLFTPWTTALAWTVLAASLTAAIRGRARYPVAAFAVLWFLAAHALESSVLPLEIGFDHRSYVAWIGPALALVWGLRQLVTQPALARVRRALLVTVALWFAAFPAAAYQAATLWGHPMEQSFYWKTWQPDSRRSYHHLADHLGFEGRFDEAIEVYEAAQARWPRDPGMPVSLVEVSCYRPDYNFEAPLRAAVEALRNPDGHVTTNVNIMHRLVTYLENGACPSVPPARLLELMRAALKAPGYEIQWQNLLILNSRVEELSGHRAEALGYLEAAIALEPKITLLKQAIPWELERGDVEKARGYVVMAESDPVIPRVERWAHREEVAGMRQLFDLYLAIRQETAPGAKAP